MKILFLDIDGVLNNTASTLTKIGRELPKTELQLTAIENLTRKFGDFGYGPKFTIDTIDPLAVSLVNRLIASDSNVRVVLSSSHRLFFSGKPYDGIQFGSTEHIEILRWYLTALGVRGAPHQIVHDVTPVLHTRRGAEIADWLQNHECSHHCAVDDDGDFAATDCNLVQTNARLGLTADEYFSIAKELVIRESAIIF